MSHSQLPVLILLAMQRFSIFRSKEYIQSDFCIEHLVCLCAESSLLLLEEGVSYDQCVLLAKICQPLPCFLLYPMAKPACYSRYLLPYYFCILVSYDEKDNFIFFGVSFRRSCRSSQNHSIRASSTLVIGAQTCITVILNVLPWKHRISYIFKLIFVFPLANFPEVESLDHMVTTFNIFMNLHTVFHSCFTSLHSQHGRNVTCFSIFS